MLKHLNLLDYHPGPRSKLQYSTEYVAVCRWLKYLTTEHGRSPHVFGRELVMDQTLVILQLPHVIFSIGEYKIKIISSLLSLPRLVLF